MPLGTHVPCVRTPPDSPPGSGCCIRRRPGVGPTRRTEWRLEYTPTGGARLGYNGLGRLRRQGLVNTTEIWTYVLKRVESVPMKSVDSKPHTARRGGRPRRNLRKDDPAYQPTQAELDEDVSVPNMTPEKLAQVMFSEARGPLPRRVEPGEPFPVIRHDP